MEDGGLLIRAMVWLMWSLEIAGKLAAAWLGWRAPWTWPVGVAFFGPDLLVLYHLFVPSAQGFCRVATRFETAAQEVALTIDDGPDAVDTPQILALLERVGARATFFVIGERAAAQPELVRAIVHGGHEIGHHTQTHPVGTFWCAGPRRLMRELDEPLAILRALGVRPRWFRAPVGIKNVLLGPALARRELRCVGWSIRSGDCFGHAVEEVAANVLRQIKPGAIVLMHEGPSVPAALRVRTIERVLAGLSERGYRCVVPRGEQLRP